MKSGILLIAILMMANPLLAKEEPAGKTTLKLSSGKHRQAIRREIESLNQEIAQIDAQVSQARSQSLVARGMTGSSSHPQVVTAEARVTAMNMQRSELESRRKMLQTELNPQVKE